MILASMLFPMWLIIGFNFFGFILNPFIWLLNKGGSNIEYMDGMLWLTPYSMLNNLLEMTLPLWGAFAITIHYLKTGIIWNGDN